MPAVADLDRCLEPSLYDQVLSREADRTWATIRHSYAGGRTPSLTVGWQIRSALDGNNVYVGLYLASRIRGRRCVAHSEALPWLGGSDPQTSGRDSVALAVVRVRPRLPDPLVARDQK
jgi:hypothetical protein